MAMGTQSKKILESILVLVFAGALFPLLKVAITDIFNLSGVAEGVTTGIVAVTGLIIVFGVLYKLWS